jgi:hypothetical protein
LAAVRFRATMAAGVWPILALATTLASPAGPLPGTRIAVQPVSGEAGAAVRAQVVRILRARKFRVVTSLATVSGTAQYPGLARQRRVAAFVVTDLEENPKRVSATFLVWSGLEGSVAGRWTVSAHPKKLAKAIDKGFWKRLGPALLAARTPPSGKLPPAPPMRIDAGSRLD